MWVTCIFIKHEYPHIHSTFSSLINSILEHGIVADQGFNWKYVFSLKNLPLMRIIDVPVDINFWNCYLLSRVTLTLWYQVNLNPPPQGAVRRKKAPQASALATLLFLRHYMSVHTSMTTFSPFDHYDYGIVYACYNMFMLQNAMTIFCTCHTATIIQPLENKHNSLKGSSIQDILWTIIHYFATTTVHTVQVPLICQINPPIHLPVHLFSPIRHRASFQIKIHNMRHLAASCSSWLGSKFQTKNLNFWGYFMSIVTQKVQLWFQKWNAKSLSSSEAARKSWAQIPASTVPRSDGTLFAHLLATR